MKKTLYILGSIEALTGCVLLWLANLTAEILPKLGRVAFQAAMAGSYAPSDYRLDITIPYLISGILIFAGTGQILLACFKKK